MPLKIKTFDDRGQVSVLNRWADGIEAQLNTQNTTIVGVQRNVVAIQNTPVVPTVGDGLIHGEQPWESDPSYIDIRDDFIPNNSTDIGQYRWVSTNTTASQAQMQGAAPNHFGEYVWGNNTTASSCGMIVLAGSAFASTNGQTIWALFDNPGWKATYIWRFRRQADNPSSAGPGSDISFNQKTIYIGLGISVGLNQLATRPVIFMGCRFDKDPSAPAISDSTFKLEVVVNNLDSGARNNTQGTVVNTGVTPASETYYRLEIQCVAAGVITMSFNGSAPSTFTVPTYTTGTNHVAANANMGLLNFNASGGPYAPGGKVTVSGLTGGNSGLNGTWNVTSGYQANTNATANALVLTPGVTGIAFTAASATVVGLPGVVPVFIFGNDSEATPVADGLICVDYFSFIQNPGVGGGTGTPNATKSRYF